VASDPRSSGLTAIYTPGDETVPEQAERLAAVACEDGEVSTVVVHSPSSGAAAAESGCVDLVQRCFAGLETRRDALWFNPHWPRRFGPLSLAVQYRGQSLTVEVSGREVRVSAGAGPGAVVRVGCGDQVSELRPGDAVRFRARGEPDPGPAGGAEGRPEPAALRPARW